MLNCVQIYSMDNLTEFILLKSHTIRTQKIKSVLLNKQCTILSLF